jgi:hypothetical protein
VRSIEGGCFTASVQKKYPKSSPPAFVAPRAAANQSAKQILSRRSQWRAATANPFRWFALPSVSGLRLVPSGRPRALGRARFRASPGIRVSRSGSRREFKTIALQTTKNPPELAGSGGSVRTDVSISLTRDRSHEPGRRYRSACSRSIVLRDFSKIRFASSDSCLHANRCSREAWEINLVSANVNMKNRKIL